MRSQVHEQDMCDHYEILKEYLILFSGDKLPCGPDHSARATIFERISFGPEGAFAYVAITMNLFPDNLYKQRGGKGKVKETETHFNFLLV